MLHYAVEGGSPGIVAALLAARPPIAAADASGSVGAADKAHADTVPQSAQQSFTPLHLAAQKGHAALITILLPAGYKAEDLAGASALVLGSLCCCIVAHSPGLPQVLFSDGLAGCLFSLHCHGPALGVDE